LALVSISITTPLHTPPATPSLANPWHALTPLKTNKTYGRFGAEWEDRASGCIVVLDSLDSPEYVTLDE